ncbi:tetratricopeptide repeat protein [Chromatium okenii]|jgi:predicted O-linked N-acetylglucosamine transferase (SPINDLY family)|uniref:tetratricopeptide repeat protein n=1 Tax=Chromatium okenii TaxID=61644 RepID=UPI0026F20C3A|nr:tetratricopeptide repeat protein [Chromatium okenii]MBV5310982.1 tetratricopeptide repeat protein [Chromatium okenii]
MANIALLLKEAVAHYRANRLNVAESLYRAILALDQDHAEAHHNLGIIEIESQQFESGLEHLRRAVKLAPKIGGYWLSLAEGLITAQQIDEARSVMNRAQVIGFNTPAAQALRKRLAVKSKKSAVIKQENPSYEEQKKVTDLLEKMQFVEAEQAASKLIERYPNDAFGWKAVGTIFCTRCEYHDALTMLLKAINLAPQDFECLNSLGNTLRSLGRLNEAIECFDRAIEINPEYAAIYNSKGVALKDLAQTEAAIDSYNRALALDPNVASTHNNLANALMEIGRIDEALVCQRRALEINPNYAEAYNNLGGILQELGQLNEAIAVYDKGLQLNPKLAMVYSNLLFGLNYHPDKSAEEIFTTYQAFDHLTTDTHRANWYPHTNNRNPERRLKVGYVSPDFRSHSSRYFLEPLLAYHNQDVIEVTAYAELTYEDESTARYRSYVDHWVPTQGLSDTLLAERIRADGIDILVDLAGHTANNRLGVFARRPTPVSVSWMGYGYTTGLSAIDYFLTDEIMAPAGSEALFAEHPWRIAVPSMVYRPASGMGEINALPALNRGFVTFGTLTRGVRINHRTIRVWSAILKRVAGSRLVINSKNYITTAMQNALAERFAVHGIHPEQLEIGYQTPPWDVLRDMDISLDCFPHNSGTTLIESLYLGVPFITLADRPSVGRLGSTVLHGAGHPEWIANSEDEYIEKTVALASDLSHLAAVRTHLRDELEASPWRDEAGFAQRVEQAYREMWRIWCANPT